MPTHAGSSRSTRPSSSLSKPSMHCQIPPPHESGGQLGTSGFRPPELVSGSPVSTVDVVLDDVMLPTVLGSIVVDVVVLVVLELLSPPSLTIVGPHATSRSAIAQRLTEP